MNKHKDHIDQLTPDLIQQYLDGKLSSEMQYKVERYLLDHPFEAEAMEGFEAKGMTQLDLDVEQMKKQLFKEEKQNIPIWQQYWKVAAVITVFFVSTFVMLNLGEQQINSSDEGLALNEVPGTEEELALVEKEMMEEPITADDVLAEEESQDLTIKPKAEQQSIGEEKEDVVVIEGDIEELAERSEAPSLSEGSELSKSTKTSRVKAVNEEEAQVLSMIESDELPRQKAMNDQIVVEGEDTSISDQFSSKMAGVSIPKRIQVSQVKPAKDKIVMGTITSAEDGVSLPGVNVILKGTNQGTISDADGNYEIKIPDGQNTLSISFIGYVNEEVEIGDRNVVDVSLYDDVSALSEVIVTTNGNARKSAAKKTKPRNQQAEPLIGFEAYNTYLEDSLIYPQQAIDNQISGNVILEIAISETGQITNIVVTEGLGYGCDEEAVRLIKEGPVWQNAIRRSNPIEEKVRINVTFE